MSLPHLILGLIRKEALSGYDLQKHFEQSILPIWTTEQNQIYRTLKKLLDQELVAVELVIQTGSPNKKLYHLTDKGRDELHKWVATPVENPPVQAPWLAQLLFSDVLEKTELMRLVDRYRRIARNYLEQLESVMATVEIDLDAADTNRDDLLSLLPLDLGITAARCEVAWWDQVAKRILENETF